MNLYEAALYAEDAFDHDELEDYARQLAACPACNGDGSSLGVLGNLIHYRCRDCGAQYSTTLEV